MPEISTFFKESESSLGIFYPKNYIVMGFPSEQAAATAYDALGESGLSGEDILLLSPAEALQYFKDNREEAGVFGDVMTGVSRALGDDATFVDRNMDNARKGSGFVFVRSTTDEESARIHQIVRPFEPLTMHWYESGGIQKLV